MHSSGGEGPTRAIMLCVLCRLAPLFTKVTGHQCDRCMVTCWLGCPVVKSEAGSELRWGQENEIIPGFQQLLGKREQQVAGGTVSKPEGSVTGLGLGR